MTPSHPSVLFLCTGNYYRSRFAEHLFNHLATEMQLPWRAFSRGLAIELLENDAGPISPHTRQGLAVRKVPLDAQVRSPIAVTEQDLFAAQHIIALKHAEHHALLLRKFPFWVSRVEFWHVHDVDFAAPEQAIPEIEQAVMDLLKRLK